MLPKPLLFLIEQGLVEGSINLHVVEINYVCMHVTIIVSPGEALNGLTTVWVGNLWRETVSHKIKVVGDPSISDLKTDDIIL